MANLDARTHQLLVVNSGERWGEAWIREEACMILAIFRAGARGGGDFIVVEDSTGIESVFRHVLGVGSVYIY